MKPLAAGVLQIAQSDQSVLLRFSFSIYFFLAYSTENLSEPELDIPELYPVKQFQSDLMLSSFRSEIFVAQGLSSGRLFQNDFRWFRGEIQLYIVFGRGKIIKSNTYCLEMVRRYRKQRHHDLKALFVVWATDKNNSFLDQNCILR